MGSVEGGAVRLRGEHVFVPSSKDRERELAREMRRDGASLNEIATTLGVSKSSASIWVRDIELTEAQLLRLRDNDPTVNKRALGAARWSEINRERRREAQSHGRALARQGDLLHAIGCML